MGRRLPPTNVEHRAGIEPAYTGFAEGRAVLHVALRAPKDEPIFVDGKDVVPEVHAVLDRMAAFANGCAAGSGRGIRASAFAML